jgi:hypothetical protein
MLIFQIWNYYVKFGDCRCRRKLHGVMGLRFSIGGIEATEGVPLDCPHNIRFSHYSRIKAGDVLDHNKSKKLAGRRQAAQ